MSESTRSRELDRAASWYEAFAARAGAHDAAEATRSLDAVLESLGETLSIDEGRVVASLLPPPLADAMERGAERNYRPGDIDDAIDAIEDREDVGTSAAREHLTAACEILGTRAGEGDALAIEARLPPWLAEMMEARRHFDPPPRRERPDPARASGPETLATGRPGSQHPLSEAKPDIAEAGSIAKSDNPHEETKLSSTKGLMQERLGETLATGKPGSRRSISRS